MAIVSKIRSVKISKKALESLVRIDVGVKVKRYRGIGLTTYDLAQKFQKSDQIFTKPFEKLTTRGKRALENIISKMIEGEKIKAADKIAVTRIITDPIYNKKYGAKRDYEGNRTPLRFVNTGKFVNSIFAKVIAKKKSGTSALGAAFLAGLLSRKNK